MKEIDDPKPGTHVYKRRARDEDIDRAMLPLSGKSLIRIPTYHFNEMKAIKISDEAYQALVKIRAKLSLENGKNHTFNDAIMNLYTRPVWSQDLEESKADDFIKNSEAFYPKLTYFIGPPREKCPDFVGIYSLLRIGEDP